MQSLLADFEVSEGIYSRACIEDTDSVCLWLGANVMLEYSCEEVQNIFSWTFLNFSCTRGPENKFLQSLLFQQATALLKNNLENAKASLEVLVGDLQFLRDQVTVTQVQRYL